MKLKADFSLLEKVVGNFLDGLLNPLEWKFTHCVCRKRAWVICLLYACEVNKVNQSTGRRPSH